MSKDSAPLPLLKAAGWLLLAALAPALLTAWLHPNRPDLAERPGDVRGLRLTEALALDRLQPVLWVDARAATAFTADRIPGAINLREDTWEDLLPGFIDTWEPGRVVVVYCDGGHCDAARAVARRLQREFEAGNVHYLEGGWEAWRQHRP